MKYLKFLTNKFLSDKRTKILMCKSLKDKGLRI